MTEQELKACPFCGEKPAQNAWWEYYCAKTGCPINGILIRTDKLWNTRTTQPQSAVDELEMVTIAIRNAAHDGYDCPVDTGDAEGLARVAIKALRPHLQAPVSLEKCAIAASQWLNGIRYEKPQWETIAAKSQAGYKDQAKLMLEAIGVKYE